jgi:hypothetical protein
MAFDREAQGTEMEQLFERNLLESGRADEPPNRATEEAWARFASALALASRLSAEPNAARGLLNGKAAVRAGYASAAKWLLLGALGGSALTAAWFGSLHGSKGALPAPAIDVRTPSVHEDVVQVPSPVSSVAEHSAIRVETQPVALSALHAQRAPSPKPALLSQERSEMSLPPAADAANNAKAGAHASALAAEVSALDVARTAIAAGAFDDALRRIAQYHRDFPSGELTADADVVAIEALSAKGDRAAVAQRSARFLAQYPNDPHAAGVRSLAAQ